MPKRPAVLIASLLVAAAVPSTTHSVRTAAPQAPQQPGCTALEQRQFDFWIGDWEVYDPNDQRVGSNRIDKVLGGCALHESWRGNSGHRGNSYNFYDSATARWHQTWIDVTGSPLYLDGGLENGSMVLRSADGAQRITWTPLDNGHVRQHWEVTQDDGATWTTAFDGDYRRVY